MHLATCFGRYSAALENAWLMGEDGAAAKLRRDLLAAMMNSFIAENTEAHALRRALLHERVVSKARIKALLNAAQFGADPRRQRLAKVQIRRDLASCDSLILHHRL